MPKSTHPSPRWPAVISLRARIIRLVRVRVRVGVRVRVRIRVRVQVRVSVLTGHERHAERKNWRASGL